MLRQYHEVKEQYPDVIVMFRLGDFYEMFGEDAVVASRELDIVLTSRTHGYAPKMPMCGFPHHAADRYVARLVSRGYRVAMCDQMEDPKLTKKLVKREVTRVVTPGTVLEDNMLNEKSNNYLAAVSPAPGLCGLAIADVSTGEFAVCEIAGDQTVPRILEELSRLSPAECLLREIDEDLTAKVGQASGGSVTKYSTDGAYRRPPREMLISQFGTSSLRGFGCEDMTAGLEAAAMILDYLEQTNAGALQHIHTIASYSTNSFMFLDPAARRNLELVQSMSLDKNAASLLSVLDKTRSAMGGRLLRRWIDQPLISVTDINARLDAVEYLLENALVRTELRETLKDMGDLERLVSRIVSGTSANARDLVGLKNSLTLVPHIKSTVSGCQLDRITALGEQIELVEDVVDLVSQSIADEPPFSVREGGMIRLGFHEELDRLRSASKDGKSWIANLESEERERTGVKTLKVGYNSVFGYYIEVTKANLASVPEDYIRKQTTVNAERFITPSLKEYEAMVLGAQDKAVELEYTLFNEIRLQVAQQAERIVRVARAVAELDALASLAEVAAANGYVKPEVDEEEDILIRNGRHPVVEHSLLDSRFVPNDCNLNCETDQLLIITGPNMAGKSTYLRQVALIVLMAQIGSFVPADSAKIGIVDRIFTRVGAHDELASGQSTFMVEMNETANLLNNATRRSLIVLDEIGRGTSTYDGLSIAWAVAEQIRTIGAKTLFATHYHHLNELEKTLAGVKNYRIAVKEEADRIVWLRKIMPGGTDRSYGIEVARLAGLPHEVIERAKEVLQDLEKNDTSAQLVDRKQKVQAKTQKLQLTLFETEKHPALEELQKLDLATMSPIEALMKLDELQRKAKS